MTKQINIGPLTFIGDRLGGHIHVSVLGAGDVGQRPLAGTFVVGDAEWEAFANQATIIDLATTIGSHWRTQEGINGVLLDRLAQVTK